MRYEGTYRPTAKTVALSAGIACMLGSAATRADVNLTDLEANAAAAQQTAVKDGWQGSVALGYLQTTGNANTSTANGKALIGYKAGNWQDSILVQALKASQEGALTAENFEADGQSDYNLNPDNYLFGNVDYLRDVFSGYERRTSEVVGLGHRLIDSPTQQLDVELGGGRRQTRYTTGFPSSEEWVERVAGSYLWKFTSTSSLTESLSVVHGSSNTLTQSVTAVTANLVNSFALSFSYTVSHNSSVLDGFKKTDAVTALSLVYTFVPDTPVLPSSSGTANSGSAPIPPP
jgi:putative salt-induced outer membrane protein